MAQQFPQSWVMLFNGLFPDWLFISKGHQAFLDRKFSPFSSLPSCVSHAKAKVNLSEALLEGPSSFRRLWHLSASQGQAANAWSCIQDPNTLIPSIPT